MWLLVYTSKEAKEIEALIRAINKRSYKSVESTIRIDIIRKLEASTQQIKYLELEDSAEEEKAKKNFSIDSFPALIHLDKENKEVLEVHYREKLFLDDFTIDYF